MQILQMVLIRNILGFGLQSFALVLGIYTFNRQRVIFKDYILASVILIILSYVMKLLPITINVQTITNMILTYLICVIFLKMSAYKTIRSTSICFALILLCEILVTTIAMITMRKEEFEILIDNPIQRNYIGVLASVIFAMVITVLHIVLRKGDNYGSTSS